MSVAVDPEVAALVREVLAEEVAKMRAEKGERVARAGAVREERVRIRNDADLQDLVRRVLAVADDRKARRALAEGRIRFRLDGEEPTADTGAAAFRSPPAAGGADATRDIEAGLFSERHAERLPRETTRLRLGPGARLTPLARDLLRRRGIAIERKQR